jgi:hypothetical protein
MVQRDIHHKEWPPFSQPNHNQTTTNPTKTGGPTIMVQRDESDHKRPTFLGYKYQSK